MPTTSGPPKRSTTLKEKLLRVRRDLTKSLRMDRSDQQPDVIPSPFRKRGYSDTSSEDCNSGPYIDETPYSNYHGGAAMAEDEQLDGSSGMFSRKRANPPIAAIFVHAGAGFHSTTNEQFHLAACNDACKLGMKMLKSGGSAVDAVEAAIRVLEDREITNSGYGSNLSIQGCVESDATVVDHKGRSGACGATPQVKNPIHLARTILELSHRPLSLRRVPPNLLVGQGATQFARENGVTVVPHEAIISKNAQERWNRWKEDLKRAEQLQKTPPHSSPFQEEDDDKGSTRRDHANALLTGTWNEGQPDSPAPSSPGPRNSPYFSPSPELEEYGTLPSNAPVLPTLPQQAALPPRTNVRSPSSSPQINESPTKRPRYSNRTSEGPQRTHSPLSQHMDYTRDTPNGSDGADSPLRRNSDTLPPRVDSLNLDGEREDHITDTVGAIAIDYNGRIAAASSSGGIGMKHSGRVGPAALVGIGTAVIPVDDQDPDGVTVAAVTSGTGEHMATTMASQKCCERLYNNSRKGAGRGVDVECSEEDAIESFVTWDFMEHPGVVNSHSAGAIGVMAVKKMPGGYYLHFAHNTDSFALASMHSNEPTAKCVMSRLGERSKVVQGGRKIRAD